MVLVAAWKEKHPKQEHPDVEEEKSAVLELIRNEGLSIRHLDEETKGRVRAVIEELHLHQRISLTDIADLIGNKTSGYSSWLTRQLGIIPRPFEEARLEGIYTKVRKHARLPFDGTDEDKAYLLGMSHGDFHVSRPFGDAVKVSTSTTHPALVDLFTELFSRYGHVGKYPRYKKDTRTYEWNIQVILDDSFAFLLASRDECHEWVTKKESTMMAYLAGLIDAEGNLWVYPNPRTVGIVVSIWNTDTALLEFAHDCLSNVGARPLAPYLHSLPGPISTGFRIERKKAYWRVLVARIDEVQLLLRRLPLRHKEKVAMKNAALEVSKGEPYQKVEEKVLSLRKSFKEEARQFTRQAEEDYLRTHPIPSPPVLCFLQRSAGDFGLDEHYERRLLSTQGFHAVHEDLCLEDIPCVMICEGCDETNVSSIFVHESIHHALLWMSDELYNPVDPLDDIVQFMHSKGVVEPGF